MNTPTNNNTGWEKELRKILKDFGVDEVENCLTWIAPIIERIKEDGERIGRSYVYNEVIPPLLKEKELEAYNKGYWARDKEEIDNIGLEKAEIAHKTKEGYCCACGYDMAVFAGKIKERELEIIESIENMSSCNCNENKNWGKCNHTYNIDEIIAHLKAKAKENK